MQHLRSGILMLTGSGKSHRKHFPMCARFHQITGWIFHRHLGSKIGIHPLMGGICIHLGPLGHQVIYIGGPILDGAIARTRPFLYDDFDHAAVEGVGGVLGCRAAFHIMNLSAFIYNNERSLKLTDIGSVQSESRPVAGGPP